MKRILLAKIMQNRVVQLRFDDGLEGTIDFSQYASTGVFRRWEDPEFFAQMTIAHEGRALEWPGEIDLCADSLWIEAGCGSAEEVFALNCRLRPQREGSENLLLLAQSAWGVDSDTPEEDEAWQEL